MRVQGQSKFLPAHQVIPDARDNLSSSHLRSCDTVAEFLGLRFFGVLRNLIFLEFAINVFWHHARCL